MTGLLDKLADREFVRYVHLLVCLGETLLDRLRTETFPEHFGFVKPAVKLRHTGKKSGGVITLVRKKAFELSKISRLTFTILFSLNCPEAFSMWTEMCFLSVTMYASNILRIAKTKTSSGGIYYVRK